MSLEIDYCDHDLDSLSTLLHQERAISDHQRLLEAHSMTVE